MNVSYMVGQMAESNAKIDQLARGLSSFQKQREEATRIARGIEAMTVRFSSPFEKLVLQDRLWTYFPKVGEFRARVVAWLERSQKDHMLISAELPKRGWYLSGREPCTLTDRLAKAVRKEEWDTVDQEMMEHLPQFEMNPLRAWLVQEGVPDYCIARLYRFLKHHTEGNYEEATYLGVPLLDEIAKHLYGGKTFTTKRTSQKRSNQSKPELAFKTSSGPDLESYCESFVQTFGSLQEDPDDKSLADENYWNRHAIVHGLMRRAMGVKDSAKCLMAMKFLFFARKEDETTDGSDASEPDSKTVP